MNEEGSRIWFPSVLENKKMIDLKLIQETLVPILKKDGYELITLKCSPANEMLVEIDSFNGVDVDYCAQINRFLQTEIEKQTDDYELEVGSVSLTDPFKTVMQYRKHLGKEIELLRKADSKKLKGVLVDVEDEYFAVDVEEKVKVEGKKRPQLQITTLNFKYDDVVYAKYLLKV